LYFFQMFMSNVVRIHRVQTYLPWEVREVPILLSGNVNKRQNISGFSLVELIVVMFLLSILVTFTLPIFKVPGIDQKNKQNNGRNLARFIGAVRLKAIKDNQNYLLHLDIFSGQAWAEISNGNSASEENTVEEGDTKNQETRESGLSISRIDFVDQRNLEQDDIIIRISSGGISDMALIHMDTEDGEITLKLHPFLTEVEIVQGDQTFYDCL